MDIEDLGAPGRRKSTTSSVIRGLCSRVIGVRLATFGPPPSSRDARRPAAPNRLDADAQSVERLDARAVLELILVAGCDFSAARRERGHAGGFGERSGPIEGACGLLGQSSRPPMSQSCVGHDGIRGVAPGQGGVEGPIWVDPIG